MAGTSDKPFRILCRELGAALTTSEMVVLQKHLLNTNKSKHRLDFSSEKSPISIQIAGSEAKELAESARQAVEFGANTNKSKHRLDFSSEKSPISIQIAGSEAEELAESARQSVEFGADIIDINMGCPAKKVCNKAAGSALMQNEKLVEDIIKSVVNAVDIPVTLKMRTGWNEENKNAPIIARIAERKQKCTYYS